jgi:dienelactone hydrolase
MDKIIYRLIISCLLLTCDLMAMAQREEIIKEISNKIAQQFIAGQYDKMTLRFDSVMISRLPPSELEHVWQSVNAFYGDFQMAGEVKLEYKPPLIITYIPFRFSKSTLDFKLSFDSNEKVVGLFLIPPQPHEDTYINKNLFSEKEMKVGVYDLPGLLSMPVQAEDKAKGFPLVILVHGSGPNDMNETIGPNRPFRDLAHGLASNGIAVLRYDKRTYALKNKDIWKDIKLTVKEETIADAIAAVALAKTLEGIDSSRIFLLGHSLGGMLAPRIAAERPGIAGLILMAAPARSMEDLIEEQMKYILSLDGLTDKDKGTLKEIREQVEAVKSNSLNEATPASSLPLSIPASYWLDLKNYDQLKVAKLYPGRFLVLQGERDYQVKMTDFELWKKSLPSQRSEFISYAKLNHLFLEGDKQSQPNEYGNRGNVPEYVIRDIVNWIQRE